MHRGGADMESQVDINICTDGDTHSIEGMETEISDTHSATQGHPSFHVTIQRGWIRIQNSG